MKWHVLKTDMWQSSILLLDASFDIALYEFCTQDLAEVGAVGNWPELLFIYYEIKIERKTWQNLKCMCVLFYLGWCG